MSIVKFSSISNNRYAHIKRLLLLVPFFRAKKLRDHKDFKVSMDVQEETDALEKTENEDAMDTKVLVANMAKKVRADRVGNVGSKV